MYPTIDDMVKWAGEVTTRGHSSPASTPRHGQFQWLPADYYGL